MSAFIALDPIFFFSCKGYIQHLFNVRFKLKRFLGFLCCNKFILNRKDVKISFFYAFRVPNIF